MRGRVTRRASLPHAILLLPLLALTACAGAQPPAATVSASPRGPAAQVPDWSRDDLDFFLHGSMGTEVIPERVLRAFVVVYPELFPSADLSNFGLIADPAFGWPVGVSRRPVAYLGSLSAVGINCASCHVAELVPVAGGPPLRVLGATASFDAEALFGAMTIATFRTAEPKAMRRFLAAYLASGEPPGDEAAQRRLAAAWQRQDTQLAAAIVDDPFAAKGVAPGALHPVDPAALRLDAAALETTTDLEPTVRGLLKLFHNMRAALHIPDQLPAAAPPPSGPGRNDAFGLLSAALFGDPRPYAPVKYGIVWNLAGRRWVHWDGNTQSPIGRNLLAALGLGAPLVDRRGELDFALIERHTRLSEAIRAPRYPFAIDAVAADRGAVVYRARCAACHDGGETDGRLHDASEIGTDATRAQAFGPEQAARFNRLLREVEIRGYAPPGVPGLRATQKYWAPNLAGVWARSPYLHNGSVRTLAELLTPPASRPLSFQRGSRRYDTAEVGYADEGAYRLDVRGPGSSNAGHVYGTDLPVEDKRHLIEYLKTR
jgi:mono/diheme cytochrome c family protein